MVTTQHILCKAQIGALIFAGNHENLKEKNTPLTLCCTYHELAMPHLALCWWSAASLQVKSSVDGWPPGSESLRGNLATHAGVGHHKNCEPPTPCALAKYTIYKQSRSSALWLVWLTNQQAISLLVGKSDRPWYWLISLVGWKQEGTEEWKQNKRQLFLKTLPVRFQHLLWVEV